MLRTLLKAVLLSLLAASAAITQSVAQTAPAGFPAYLRWDLAPKWIEWNGARENVNWPPNDGCAEPAQRTTLVPGSLVDRFGRQTGEFVSPQGASFRARATPYVCGAMDYYVYRIDKPVSVLSCQAAPWFGEPGGAVQIKFDVPVERLVRSGALVPVTVAPAGNPGSPQCGGP